MSQNKGYNEFPIYYNLMRVIRDLRINNILPISQYQCRVLLVFSVFFGTNIFTYREAHNITKLSYGSLPIQLSHLVRAKLIERVKRGYYIITPSGWELINRIWSDFDRRQSKPFTLRN